MRLDLLLKPLFVLALGLLLLNDFYLKYEFSNILTGKLSDVAGLFLFPYFLSCFRIRWARPIYFVSGLLFIFWKSIFSQGLMDWWQSVGIGINRVVDYTDLLALFILPLSFLYFQKQLSAERNVSRLLSVPAGVLTLFAIWATTLPREEVKLYLPIDEVYELNMSKEAFFRSISAGHGYRDTLPKNMNDSLFYIHFDILYNTHIDVTALTTITAIDSTRTSVRLDTIVGGQIIGRLLVGVDKEDVEHFKSMSAEEFKTYFEENCIDLIREGEGKIIYYDNKDIYDTY